MIVCDLPLGLERRYYRRADLLGQCHHLVAVEAGSVANDDHRAVGRRDQLERLVERTRRRADLQRRETAIRAGRVAVSGGECLHLVGEDQVRGALLEDRVLARKGHQLGVLGGLEHRLGPPSDLSERSREVHFLERPGSEHLGVDLPGQRQYRRAVNVRVPETGEQVRCSRSCDREARRGPAGELAVRRGRKRRSALVSDPDIGQSSGLFLAAQGVRQAEVGMPDHPEHVAHAPVDHRLGHHVGNRADMPLLGFDADVHAVIADLDRERRHAVAERRAAIERAVVVAVPRATEHALLDRSLPEWAALVRAAVAERGVSPRVMRHGKAVRACRYGLHPALGKLVGGEHAMPCQVLRRCRRHDRSVMHAPKALQPTFNRLL